MPTYTYRCLDCNHSQEITHSMSYDKPVTCGPCGGNCRRVITSVPATNWNGLPPSREVHNRHIKNLLANADRRRELTDIKYANRGQHVPT